MQESATLPKVKTRRCVKCGQKLDTANKEKICRNSRACNERAEKQRAATSSGRKPKQRYDFSEGSVAWHLVRAAAKKYHKSVGELTTLGSDNNSARIKYSLYYLLRQDAKLEYPDIAKFFDTKSTANVYGACRKVEANFLIYRDDVLSIRQLCKNERAATVTDPPKSVLVVA